MNPKTTPTVAEIQQRAESYTAREMERRTQQSIFDGRGQLRPDAAAQTHTGQLSMGDYLAIGDITFPPEPYGSEYTIHLARLSEYMGTLPVQFGGVIGGPLDAHDQKAMHALAMLHTIGMGTMGMGRELRGIYGYAERSAAFADQFLRGAGAGGTSWGNPEMRETVCRLIRFHDDTREIKLDKRLQIFADARRLELARITPNTTEGLALLKEQWQPDRFYMMWSKDKENARAYMTSRGWK